MPFNIGYGRWPLGGDSHSVVVYVIWSADDVSPLG